MIKFKVLVLLLLSSAVIANYTHPSVNRLIQGNDEPVGVVFELVENDKSRQLKRVTKRYMDLGNVYERQGELNKAKKQYESAIKKLGTSGSTLDLSAAKAAHLNWKTKLGSFLDGKSTLSKEQAVSHHHCEFGKWYYSDGLKNFGHLQAMKDVEDPHEQLHELIRMIIDMKTNGQISEAEQAYQNVASISEKIVGLLSAAEQQAATSH